MKKNLLFVVAAVFGVATMYGQAYISVSGGYGFETSKKVLGREISTEGVVTDLEGSYGAGFQTQLRGGYFFTKRLGVEVAAGYLHGKELPTNKSSVVNMKARGRAFGASLSAVFNITNNLYLRAGGVTKIGGQTEAITTINLPIPGHLTKVEFQNNFHGKMPFGFIGGLGCKFKVAENISIFVEGEYLNINVPRKTSKLESFSATYNGMPISRDVFVANMKRMSGADQRLEAVVNQISPLLEDEYDWQGKGAPDAPYSSIGVNFGLIYSF